ncbi:MAG: serine/threonine protein kinase [Sedimentisphaerales bacterium]|nr:serine/threonine protein kinase [Sedimentisphaerales bacterium]
MAGESTNQDTLFGKMAVEQGLCTGDELKRCIEEMEARRKNNPVLLQELLISKGFITATQAQRLRQAAREVKAATHAHQIPGYQVLGKIGAGAMAVVYKAKQLSLNRVVAIKVLPKRFSENPDYVERFYKEGQAAGKLNHPNIVQAVDVGEAGGYHYFVMEFVEGKTLYDDIAAGKVFSEQEALDIIIQVAEALRHAHSMGLIHRDVKPKNIMINKDGVVKLADMGLARERTDIEAAKTEKGKAYGTPYYISPEQIRGEMDIDGRADIYGLGATFYHLVTGRVPYMAEDPVEVMKKHLRDQLIPPDHINTTLSAGISEMIEVMMAKNKADRYSNMDELLEDLKAVRTGQAPMFAHKRIDVSAFEQLEDGETVELGEKVSVEQIETKYKNIILVLGALSAILLLVIIMMFLMR